jgi:hypothetical protein
VARKTGSMSSGIPRDTLKKSAVEHLKFWLPRAIEETQVQAAEYREAYAESQDYSDQALAMEAEGLLGELENLAVALGIEVPE